MTEIILATDMAAHSKMLAQARADLQSSSFWDGPDAEGRLLAMKTIMHTADISNVCRPPVMAGMWTRAVYEEFFRQGDAEKEMGLDVTALCDRETVAIAESQVLHHVCQIQLEPSRAGADQCVLRGTFLALELATQCMQKVFLGFVVGPTWDLLKEIAPNSYKTAHFHLTKNQALWTELAEMNDPTAVLQDPTRTPELVHASPLASPFHNPARNSWCASDWCLSHDGASVHAKVSWICQCPCEDAPLQSGRHAYINRFLLPCRGNADMLLLLLNDEKNCIIGQGLAIIAQRGNGIIEAPPVRDDDSIDPR